MKSEYIKRLNEFEVYDHLSFTIVPRYKTSGLSGDEWRTSVKVEYYFKGTLIKTETFSNMEAALVLAHTDIFHSGRPIDTQVLEIEERKCDQPGCSQDYVGRMRLKKETSRQGDYLDLSDTSITHFRKFCLVHIERGDCSREDADDNYISLDKVSAPDSQNNEESPAIFGGVIDLSFPGSSA